jgi:hypothetical protein
MPEHRTIIVTQNNGNDGGCPSGCGTMFAVRIVVGLIVKDRYLAVPVGIGPRRHGHLVGAGRRTSPPSLSSSMASSPLTRS